MSAAPVYVHMCAFESYYWNSGQNYFSYSNLMVKVQTKF